MIKDLMHIHKIMRHSRNMITNHIYIYVEMKSSSIMIKDHIYTRKFRFRINQLQHPKIQLETDHPKITQLTSLQFTCQLETESSIIKIYPFMFELELSQKKMLIYGIKSNRGIVYTCELGLNQKEACNIFMNWNWIKQRHGH